MAVLWLLVGGLLVFVLSWFGTQNAQTVDLDFYGIRFVGVPLWRVVVMPAIVGLLLGFLIGLPARVRGALASRRLTAQNASLQKRLTQLEHELTAAKRPAQPLLDTNVPEVPDTTTSSRSQLHPA